MVSGELRSSGPPAVCRCRLSGQLAVKTGWVEGKFCATVAVVTIRSPCCQNDLFFERFPSVVRPLKSSWLNGVISHRC